MKIPQILTLIQSFQVEFTSIRKKMIIEQKMRMKYLRFSADLQRFTRMKKKKRQPILLVCRLLSE